MANELRVRQNFIGGKVEDNPLLIGGTTLTSTALAAVPAIGSTQHYPIVLDPDGVFGEPEIVWVTAHTAGATTATILRAQESTTARAHTRDTDWLHGPTAYDWDAPLPMVKATRATAHSIPNNAVTKAVFDTTLIDTHDMWVSGATTRLTVPAGMGGKYLVGATFFWAGNATGRRQARTFINNVLATGGHSAAPPAGTSNVIQSLVAVHQLAAGDYVEFELYQDSGGALDAGGASTLYVGEMTRIGA